MPLLRRPSSPFAPPPLLYLILFHPIYIFITTLHAILLRLRGPSYRPPPSQLPIPITCISDTHSKFPKVPPSGELLIHAGDLTNTGTLNSIQQTIDWLKTLQKPWPGSSDGYRYIVVVAGNHDSFFDERSRSPHDTRTSKKGPNGRTLDWGKIIYLQHGYATLTFPGDRKLKMYAAPQTPMNVKEFAFQYKRGQDAWSNTVPDDVDILITHNPPKWHLDIPENGGLGCEHELKEVWRVKPTLHVFGHIHSGYGREHVWWDKGTKLAEQFKQAAFAPFPKAQKQGVAALVDEVTNVQLLVLAVQLLIEDVKGLLWTRLWKGGRNGTIMVNAALTYQISERLGNQPQTVFL